MGKKSNVALLTGMAGLGFVMMGCPPAEEAPPAGERVIQPAPPPTDPMYPSPMDTTPPPRDPAPTDPYQPTDPIEPTEPTDPYEPTDPMEPTDPLEPTDPGQDPGNLPPPPPPGGS